jgi:hypothetical protein
LLRVTVKPTYCAIIARIYEISGLICFDLSNKFTGYFIFFSNQDALGQDTVRQTATVDHADMRGLVTYLTSLHRGAGLSLVAGIIDQVFSREITLMVNAGLARTRVLHTGLTIP